MFKLERVTMTGADDSVKPEELVKLSQEFPFVEWGILLSRKQEGNARFPSGDWIYKLSELMGDHGLDEPVHTAGHLCGFYLRQLLAEGDLGCPHFSHGIFERVQLNFHGEAQFVRSPEFLHGLRMIRRSRRDILFQIDGLNDVLYRQAKADGNLRVYPFFDKSHGAGVVPGTWPSPIDDKYCGYAGGLGPDNLAVEIERIHAAAGERTIWIDMETKVRSEDGKRFDLDKVRACLEIAKPWVK